MSLTNWFHSVRALVGQAFSLPRVKAGKKPAPRANLRLEALEDRTVPSASFDWAFAISGASVTGEAVATDGAGNVYLAGRFGGTKDFDPGAGVYSLTASGEQDGFVAKYGADGSLAWAIRIGGAAGDSVQDVAVDAAGVVYISGSVVGPADFGTLTLTGSGVYAAKLDANGNFLWATALGGNSSYVSASPIAIDASGNVYVTGDLNGNGAVAKLNAAGGVAWVADVAASGLDIAVDSAGNVIVTGDFGGTVDFNPGAGTYNLYSGGRSVQPSTAGFVLKLNNTGGFVWADAFQAGNWSVSHAKSLAIDASNNIYVTGSFGGNVDFDPGKGKLNLPNAGGLDIFVVKLNSAGKLAWGKSMGGSDHDDAADIALDSAGNIYLSGGFYGTSDFDPGAGVYNLSAVGGDIVVVKLTNAGNLDWAVSAGGPGTDGGAEIAVDGSGNVYTTGTISSGTADFDPGAGLAEVTGPGAFLWKLVQP